MFKKIIVFIGIFSFYQASFAALHLELTQGVDSAVPIGILQFGAKDNLSATAASNLNAVMRQDFTNTGRFSPIDTSSLQQPTSAQSVNLKYWQGQGVNDIVVGNIVAAGRGRYNVSFAVLDVFKVNRVKALNPKVAADAPILAEQTFKNIPEAEMRNLAHHIDDIVYLQLTGERGIFSTKIAYILVKKSFLGKTRYSLEISDYDGNNPHTILSSSQPIMSPAWAPNARQIAYVSFEDRMAAIYLTDVVSGKRHLISEFPGVNGAPAFSPNGREMALVLTKTDELKIYIMNLKNKRTEKITSGYAIDTEPNWSPDGKSMLFTSDRAGGPQIYEINLRSKQVQRVTFDGDYNARASFTPDGKNIVLLHRDSGGPYSIAVMNMDSGILRMLVQGYDVQSPSVSPNGGMIIYSNRVNDKNILAEVSIDGKVQLSLPSQDGDVRDPAWSPFWDK